MATVAQLVEDVSEVMAEKPETVNAYARALIDSGDLPKSRGRAIAQIEHEHVGKLMLVTALAPKIKEADVVLAKYWDLEAAATGKLAGVTLGLWVKGMIGTIYNKAESDEDRECRRGMIDQEIVVNETWVEVEVRDGGGVVVRFQETPNTFWEGCFKRQSHISCRAFLLLGFGKGRDYLEWSND